MIILEEYYQEYNFLKGEIFFYFNIISTMIVQHTVKMIYMYGVPIPFNTSM